MRFLTALMVSFIFLLSAGCEDPQKQAPAAAVDAPGEATPVDAPSPVTP